MNDVTNLLNAIEKGEPRAANDLLPLIYDELRKLAAQKLVNEKLGQTLQPTALVHEAYLRLVGPANADGFANRRHFFGAASEAMRRILVEYARSKKAIKGGGGLHRVTFYDEQAVAVDDERFLELDLALQRLTQHDPRLGELVKLKFFGGLTLEQAATVLEISSRTAKRDWAYARAWLQREVDSAKS